VPGAVNYIVGSSVPDRIRDGRPVNALAQVATTSSRTSSSGTTTFDTTLNGVTAGATGYVPV